VDDDQDHGEEALFGTSFLRDTHAVQARLRALAPVHRAVAPNGAQVWVVLRYDDAQAAFTDPRLSKDAAGLRAALAAKLGESARGVALTRLVMPHMLHSDPPDHTRMRRLVVKAFTRRQVESLRPRITEFARALLDRLAGRSEADLVAEYAFPLPTMVISELIGVPLEDQERFRGWSDDFARGGDPGEQARAAGRITSYLAGRLPVVRAEPKDDLLSELVRAHDDDDDRLNDEELLGTVLLLMVAGHETSANLIANGTLALLRERERWESVCAEPESLPGVIEELLRFDGPGTMASLRFTTAEVEIGGVAIPAGEIVLIGLSSANRDPARFRDPDRLDPRREPKAHLAFGHGIHFCAGAQLARLEAEIAFRELTGRFPGMRLAAAPDRLSWRPSLLFRGLHALPVAPGP
jgi:cytochrome P450